MTALSAYPKLVTTKDIMTTSSQSGRYFADALCGRENITDRYVVLGDLPDLVGVSALNEDEFVANVRRLIDTQAGGTDDISTVAAPGVNDAVDLYHSNFIAAVDGTDAVSSVRFASDTLYAAGVILVTPQTQHRPRAHVARTRAAHLAPGQNLGTTLEQAIQEWEEYLRGARQEEHSWINTFREYEEREVAYGWLQEDDRHVVLLDGPILTQNMLTQERAHALLNSIVSEERAIGFIKNLSANPLLSAIGYALNPGEVFVMHNWSRVLVKRFGERQQNISQWITSNAPDMVRAVYKMNQKAFGIECAGNKVPLALAILEHDNAGPSDHDIPMLLQIADNHVRTTFNGARARDELIARFSANNPSRFLTLTNERSIR